MGTHKCSKCGKKVADYEGGICEPCGIEMVKKAGAADRIKAKLETLRRRQGNGRR